MEGHFSYGKGKHINDGRYTYVARAVVVVWKKCKQINPESECVRAKTRKERSDYESRPQESR